jgi:hypothetical protein
MYLNKVLLFGMFFAVSSAAFSSAPELKEFMPTSWEKISRLPEIEEEAFLDSNHELIVKIAGYVNPANDWQPFWGLEIDIAALPKRIYQERAGNKLFYRILFTEEKEIRPRGPFYQFVQALVEVREAGCKLLSMNIYNRVLVSEDGHYLYPSGMDIIRSGDGSYGILLNFVPVLVDIIYSGDWEFENAKLKYLNYVKGQVSGNARAYFYLIDDIPDDAAYYEYGGIFLVNDEAPYIHIQSQYCLVDPKTPLRYSLAAAFDNNPATSYVENSKDDLLSISFGFWNSDKDKLPLVTKFSIINGYAESENLYYRNNRPKEVEISKSEPRSHKANYLLKDSVLHPQVIIILQENDIRWWGVDFDIKNVYRGSAYNDTCIAEINLEFDSRVWIFGNIDD